MYTPRIHDGKRWEVPELEMLGKSSVHGWFLKIQSRLLFSKSQAEVKSHHVVGADHVDQGKASQLDTDGGCRRVTMRRIEYKDTHTVIYI